MYDILQTFFLISRIIKGSLMLQNEFYFVGRFLEFPYREFQLYFYRVYVGGVLSLAFSKKIISHCITKFQVHVGDLMILN